MSAYYNILAKISIVVAIFVLYVCFCVSEAQAKISTDPNYVDQQKMWEQIGAPLAWDYSIGSRAIVVATIDTGTDIEHRDLENNIWLNQGEIVGNNIDDDNNGYVDDIHGWNFLQQNNDVLTPTNQLSEDPDAVKHGTVTAGLIGAIGDNNFFGAGLNWRISIMPLRAMSNDGSGLIANVIRAIDYAVDNGADVISMSIIGETYDEDFHASLRRAYDHGVVVVAAAGNNRHLGNGKLDEFPQYPVCADASSSINWMMGVTSVNNSDQLSAFANYGSCIDISAPGEGIYSTERYFAGSTDYDREFGGRWRGTSFAAPIVAGAAALIKSFRPDWQAKQINTNLLATAENIDNINSGFSNQIGVGRLNVGKLLSQAGQPTPAELASLIKQLFYRIDNKIYSYNIEKAVSKVAVKINEAKLVDFVVGDINNDRNSELVALIQRDKYYYIRILRQDGRLLREFSLPNEAKVANESARQIKLRLVFDKRTELIVEKNYSSFSKFVIYDLFGNKSGEFAPIKKPDRWTVDSDGSITFARVDKNGLILEKINRNNKIIASWKLSQKGIKLYDLQSGKVWFGKTDQSVVIISRDNIVESIIVDLPSKSVSRQEIATLKKNEIWGMIMDPFKKVILPYNTRGGDFVVADGKGRFGGVISLPKISSVKWVQDEYTKN